MKRRLTVTEQPSGAHHRCNVCDKVATWGPTWRWYGSYKAIDEGNPIIKVCSEDCRKTAILKKLMPDMQPDDGELSQ